MSAIRPLVIAALLAVALPVGAAAQQVVYQPPQRDSVWNGALIGAGLGAVGAWAFTRYNCGPAGYDDECTYIAAPVGAVTFVPGGAIVGAVIDWLIQKPAGPRPSRSWHLTPAVGTTKAKGRRGAVVMLSGTIDLGLAGRRR
jgi:hypothetical protein